MNEYEDRLKKLGKYIKETMDPINIAVSKFNNSLKPITDFVERLNIKLKPFFEIIDREYNVDKDKYDIAIQQLCNNGFYLPFLSTPRLYIEINSYSNEQLEIKYTELFENEEKNMTIEMDFILSAMEELVHPDWEYSIKQSIEMGNAKSYYSRRFPKRILPRFLSTICWKMGSSYPLFNYR